MLKIPNNIFEKETKIAIDFERNERINKCKRI